ncbi:hypothetical protein HPB48_022136 [Haemaphysalis longicornis]|uniref:Uncharacterized protein n=1 Tax=Haemaphysalis longicornis TaxID=44386 RepID=A0A9J6GGK1_HAELO|nr:hypothetical protein HPB48_022136 [Haemaphysalis longicornis]
MHAVVRFIDDEDKRLHIVPVDAIVNFKPKDERDFSKSTLYNVYWQDPVEANTGMYRAQVLMLADMLRYWGEQKQVDVAAVVPNVPRLLTEKIQDVRKSQKKLSTVARNLASADLASTDLASKDLAPKDLAAKDLAPKDLAAKAGPKDLAPRTWPPRTWPPRTWPPRTWPPITHSQTECRGQNTQSPIKIPGK